MLFFNRNRPLQWQSLADLKGHRVGITNGYCFAGNAALLGCCDVIIATEGSNIGMGGPAMVEGGGLGVFRPEEIGPLDVHIENGVVDIAVANEAEAVAAANAMIAASAVIQNAMTRANATTTLKHAHPVKAAAIAVVVSETSDLVSAENVAKTPITANLSRPAT